MPQTANNLDSIKPLSRKALRRNDRYNYEPSILFQVLCEIYRNEETSNNILTSDIADFYILDNDENRKIINEQRNKFRWNTISESDKPKWKSIQTNLTNPLQKLCQLGGVERKDRNIAGTKKEYQIIFDRDKFLDRYFQGLLVKSEIGEIFPVVSNIIYATYKKLHKIQNSFEQKTESLIFAENETIQENVLNLRTTIPLIFLYDYAIQKKTAQFNQADFLEDYEKNRMHYDNISSSLQLTFKPPIVFNEDFFISLRFINFDKEKNEITILYGDNLLRNLLGKAFPRYHRTRIKWEEKNRAKKLSAITSDIVMESHVISVESEETPSSISIASLLNEKETPDIIPENFKKRFLEEEASSTEITKKQKLEIAELSTFSDQVGFLSLTSLLNKTETPSVIPENFRIEKRFLEEEANNTEITKKQESGIAISSVFDDQVNSLSLTTSLDSSNGITIINMSPATRIILTVPPKLRLPHLEIMGKINTIRQREFEKFKKTPANFLEEIIEFDDEHFKEKYEQAKKSSLNQDYRQAIKDYTNAYVRRCKLQRGNPGDTERYQHDTLLLLAQIEWHVELLFQQLRQNNKGCDPLSEMLVDDFEIVTQKEKSYSAPLFANCAVKNAKNNASVTIANPLQLHCLVNAYIIQEVWNDTKETKKYVRFLLEAAKIFSKQSIKESVKSQVKESVKSYGKSQKQGNLFPHNRYCFNNSTLRKTHRKDCKHEIVIISTVPAVAFPN